MSMSQSAIELHRLLEEKSAEADAIKERFHRTVLWKWRTGRGKPSADVLGILEQLSGGRVRANDWLDIAKTGKPTAAA